MNPLDLVKLTALMHRTSGSPEVKIGFIGVERITVQPHVRLTAGRLSGGDA